jgi:hypothetical protein
MKTVTWRGAGLNAINESKRIINVLRIIADNWIAEFSNITMLAIYHKNSFNEIRSKALAALLLKMLQLITRVLLKPAAISI